MRYARGSAELTRVPSNEEGVSFPWLEFEGNKILLCHGSPRSTTEYLFENRSDGFLRQFVVGGKDDAHADVIVFGHTNVPLHRVTRGVHWLGRSPEGCRPKSRLLCAESR